MLIYIHRLHQSSTTYTYVITPILQNKEQIFIILVRSFSINLLALNAITGLPERRAPSIYYHQGHAISFHSAPHSSC
jgi:hypothetical protein